MPTTNRYRQRRASTPCRTHAYAQAGRHIDKHKEAYTSEHALMQELLDFRMESKIDFRPAKAAAERLVEARLVARIMSQRRVHLPVCRRAMQDGMITNKQGMSRRHGGKVIQRRRGQMCHKLRCKYPSVMTHSRLSCAHIDAHFPHPNTLLFLKHSHTFTQ